jgi:DNA-directed RNA polymerase specialized sigma24 family protein
VEGRPPGELPDEKLIAAARAGDDAAFAVLVQRYADMAFRAAYVVLGDADMAADAAQEGFISVHRALDRFRLGEPFRPWLLRIVGNRARNLRRAGRRHATAVLDASRAAAPDHAASPETLVGREEERRTIVVESRATVEALEVDGHAAYWISGAPHILRYSDPAGSDAIVVSRLASDALVWQSGEVVYRIESALGRDATLSLAEQLVPLD